MQEGTLGNLAGGHLRPSIEEVRELRVRPGHSGGERTGHRGCDVWSNLKGCCGDCGQETDMTRVTLTFPLSDVY